MKPQTDKNVTLLPEIMDFIAQWKGKQGNLIMVLHKVQQSYGYVPREVALKLTELLDVPLAKIYGVLTFYHLFKLKKPGKHKIAVCMGTACYLKGAQEILDELSVLLKCAVNQTTADGLYSVEAVRCIGCCGLAPVMTINDEVFGKVNKDELTKILAKYK